MRGSFASQKHLFLGSGFFMSFPKLLVLIALVLFGTIGIAAFLKKGKTQSSVIVVNEASAPVEIVLNEETEVVQSQEKESPLIPQRSDDQGFKSQLSPLAIMEKPVPEANRIDEFFNKSDPKFPVVETITYKSRVDWQKGRPAWLSDYASHYATSRHFIARSLNGKPDYFKQDIAEGDRFNVFKQDKEINFYLLIDVTRSKMWFYYHDLGTNERTLVKTYQVGLGRIDSQKPSGMLTPLGKYSLGNKIAIYKPKTLGFHNGKQIEMIRVFGTRWIPFEKEIQGCSAPAKGFGIHGAPWTADAKGDLIEDTTSLGKYESDGCVRLASQDVEELFSIIITKPTYVELVKDFHDAKLPGIEK